MRRHDYSASKQRRDYFLTYTYQVQQTFAPEWLYANAIKYTSSRVRSLDLKVAFRTKQSHHRGLSRSSQKVFSTMVDGKSSSFCNSSGSSRQSVLPTAALEKQQPVLVHSEQQQCHRQMWQMCPAAAPERQPALAHLLQYQFRK